MIDTVRCPHCEKALDTVLYTRYGVKRWRNGRWIEDRSKVDIRFRCPECGYLFPQCGDKCCFLR